MDPITMVGILIATFSMSATNAVVTAQKQKKLEKELKTQKNTILILEGSTAVMAIASIADATIVRQSMKNSTASIQAELDSLGIRLQSLESRVAGVESTNASILSGLGRKI